MINGKSNYRHGPAENLLAPQAIFGNDILVK